MTNNDNRQSNGTDTNPKEHNVNTPDAIHMVRYLVTDDGLADAKTMFGAPRMKATPVFVQITSVGNGQYMATLINDRGTTGKETHTGTWDEMKAILAMINHEPHRERFIICPECAQMSSADRGQQFDPNTGLTTSVLDCGHTVATKRQTPEVVQTPADNSQNTNNQEDTNVTTTNKTNEEVWTVESLSSEGAWVLWETFSTRAEAEAEMKAMLGISKQEYRIVSPRTGRTWRYDMAVSKEIISYEIYDEKVGARATIITNRPTINELASLELVNAMRAEGKQGVCDDPWGRDNLIARALNNAHMVWVEPSLGNPNWVYQELQDLVDSHPRMYVRVEVVQSSRGENSLLPEPMMERMESASFGFSDHNSTTFIHVYKDGKKVTWDEFPALVNMEFRNSTKLVKRCKELTRITMLRFQVPTSDLRIHLVPIEADHELLADGNVIINDRLLHMAALSIPDPDVQRRSMRRMRPSLSMPNPFGGPDIILAKREWARFNIRGILDSFEANGMLWDGGLLKGDCEGVPDHILAAKYHDELGFTPDIVMGYIPDSGIINVKSEIRSTNGMARFSFMPHHDHYEPFSNDLMMAMVGEKFFPAEDLTYSDRMWMKETYMEREAGVFPSFMKADEAKGAVHDDGTPNLSAIVSNLAWKWTFGREPYSTNPLRESGFLMKLIMEADRKRFNKRNGELSFNEEREARKDTFGNFVRNGIKLRMPLPWATMGNVLTMTMVEMSGYDPASLGYDTTKVFYFEPLHSIVYPDAVFEAEAVLHGGWDQDDKVFLLVRRVFDGDKDLGIKAVGIRMPVGYGEYSITEVDMDTLPLYHTWSGPGCPWGEDVPPAINLADRRPFVTELEDLGLQTVTFTDPDTQLTHRAIDPNYTIAEANIGIMTMLANPGVGRIINMLAAYASATGLPFPTQSFHLEEYVDFCQQKYNLQAFQIIEQDIEKFMEMISKIESPIDNWIWVNRVKAPVPEDITLVNDGYYTQLFNHQLDMTHRWDKATAKLTSERMTIENLMTLKFSEDVVKEARAMIRKFGPENNKKFGRFAPPNAQRIYRGQLNRKYVKMLMDMEPGHRDAVLMAAYQFVVDQKMKDNFFFQTPLLVDERSVTDLFLLALAKVSLAQIIVRKSDTVWIAVHKPA